MNTTVATPIPNKEFNSTVKQNLIQPDGKKSINESNNSSPIEGSSAILIKTRCGVNGCKKKLDMMVATCKCGYTSCFMHREPTLHNCTFDYKSEGKKDLEKNLIKVEADRMTNRI